MPETYPDDEPPLSLQELERQTNEAHLRNFVLSRALRAVLIFHDGGEWTVGKRIQWRELTGTNEATTEALCNAVRAALADG